MNADTRKSVHVQINRLKNLPALPEASIKILEAVNDSDIAIDKLVEVLSLQPGLVARLLGLANSAFFGQIRPINDLHTAIVHVLGLQLVKSLAVGIVLNVQLDVKQCKHFDTQSFWLHSVMTASAAQKLANATAHQAGVSAAAYTSGLLLHIGLLVVAYLCPQDLDDILSSDSKSYSRIANEIFQQFGQSHYQMGYRLLNRWNLPEVYQSLLLNHESNSSADSLAILSQCLRISQKICYLILDEEWDEMQIAAIAEQSSLPLEVISKIFYELVENKDNIQQLAAVLGS